MTATIASEMGEVANGSPHYQVLFFIGIVLFVLSLVDQHRGLLGQPARAHARRNGCFHEAEPHAKR